MSIWLKAGYGVGDLGINIFLVSTGMFLLFFLTDTLHVPPALAGLVLIIPRTWEVLSDPIMGTISDRTRSRWGRRRPFLLAGAFAFASTFALMFILPHAFPGLATAAAMCALYALACTGFTVFFIPYASMTAEMTDDYAERTSLTGFRMSFAVLGGLVGGGATLELVRLGGGGTLGFRFMGLVFAGVVLATSLVAFFATRGARTTEAGSHALPWRDQLRAVGKNRPFVTLMLTFLLQSLAVGILMASLVYFLRHVMRKPETAIGTVFGVFYGFIVLSMPLWVWLSKKVGKLAAYWGGVLLFCLSLLGTLAVGPDSMGLFYVLIAGCGAGCAAFYLFPFSMLPDTIDCDELASGARREGMFNGVWASGQKVAYSFAPAVVGFVMQLSGFVPNLADGAVQPPSAAAGIRWVFCVAPAACLLASLLILRKYELSEARFQEVKEQLARAKAASAAPADGSPTARRSATSGWRE
ncbi:MAG: MFS transporter [Myxococcaceae bacterium]